MKKRISLLLSVWLAVSSALCGCNMVLQKNEKIQESSTDLATASEETEIQGVKKAEGAYVFFLNAGDAFESENVLAKVEEYLGSKKDIFYGNVRKGDQIETYPEVLGKGYLVYREKMVCHQAIFASRKLLLRMPFDTTL